MLICQRPLFPLQVRSWEAIKVDVTAPLTNISADVAVTAAEGNIGSCFLRALLFPHMPPSQFPVIIPTERQVGQTWRKRVWMWGHTSAKCDSLGVRGWTGDGKWTHTFLKIAEHRQQKKTTRREKIRRPKTQRKKIKGWNFTMRYLSSAGSHCCWCQPVKTPARSKVTYHIKFSLSMFSSCSLCPAWW